jgi:hypothetical protein
MQGSARRPLAFPSKGCDSEAKCYGIGVFHHVFAVRAMDTECPDESESVESDQFERRVTLHHLVLTPAMELDELRRIREARAFVRTERDSIASPRLSPAGA